MAKQISDLVNEFKQELKLGAGTPEVLLAKCNAYLTQLNGLKHLAGHINERRAFFNGQQFLYRFRKNLVKSGLDLEVTLKWQEISSAFKRRVFSAMILNTIYKDPGYFLDACCVLFKQKVSNQITYCCGMRRGVQKMQF